MDTLYKRRRTFVTAGFFAVLRGLGRPDARCVVFRQVFLFFTLFVAPTAVRWRRKLSKKNLIVVSTWRNRISLLRKIHYNALRDERLVFSIICCLHNFLKLRPRLCEATEEYCLSLRGKNCLRTGSPGRNKRTRRIFGISPLYFIVRKSAVFRQYRASCLHPSTSS